MAEPNSKVSMLGARLRMLRKKAGLSQPELARRMGWAGAGKHSTVGRLERGEFENPTVLTIDRFLRACNARWTQVADVLDGYDALKLDLQPAGRPGLTGTEKAKVHRSTEQEVRRYERAQPFNPEPKPATPEVRVKRSEKPRNYRLVANTVEQALGQMLHETALPPIQYSLYRAVGRHLLGMIWRAAKTEAGRKALLAAAPSLPPKLVARLEAKERDWRKQKLNPELVGKIQALVLAWVLELLRQKPELFSS